MKTLTAFLVGLFLSVSLAASGLRVAFNTKSHKYHYLSCSAARRCTVHCVEMGLGEAIGRGGVACLICHPPVEVSEGE